MEKLYYPPALSEEILSKIEKPARYIGREINAVVKDKNAVDIRFVMCFPDVYEIGMSHLGISVLYNLFNGYDDVWCERVYSPWPDLHTIMKEKQIPLFGLESQEPVKAADFLGITLQYEMCYTNILQVLDLSGIPFMSADRGEDDPIVCGGGPCSYNAEPIADFFDFFYIGEGETHYREIFDIYKENRENGGSRAEFLRRISTIHGIYVPSLYEISYNEDGTIAAITGKYPETPLQIEKNAVNDFDHCAYPVKPVIPYIKCTQDRMVLEIQRGCIRGCRFCQAGQLYRPVREKSAAILKEQAQQLMKNTGHEEISLTSLSSSDYAELPQLIDFLMEECASKKVNISLPSLRIDSFSIDIMNKVQDVRKSSLTFAPEAGSQRMRDVINKGLSEEVILRGAHMAFESGWTKVKLYFMLGLPTETDEDIEGIGDLANKIAAEFFEAVPKEKRREGVQITVSTSFFIPKPFTAFQWAPMCSDQDFIDKAHVCKAGIRSQLNQKRIKYNWHEAKVSLLEGILARGDRKLTAAIVKAYEKGCIFDAWTEYYNHELWLESFAETGIDIPFYTTRARERDEIFPWDMLDCGVSRDFLWREWQKALEESLTPNCRKACSACGASKYKSGVCTIDRKVYNDEETIARTGQVLKKTTEDSEKLPDTAVLTETAVSEEVSAEKPTDRIKVRICFSKHGILKYIGHLDVMRYFQKAFRRAEIDIAYSQGFSPHQIMSFAAPLGIGIISDAEYMDVELQSLPDIDELVQKLNEQMAEGIVIRSAVILPEKAGNAMASMAAADYCAYCVDEFGNPDIDKTKKYTDQIIGEYLSREEITVSKHSKKSGEDSDKNIRPGIFRLKTSSYEEIPALYMFVSASSSYNVKPADVLATLEEFSGNEHCNWQIIRLETYRNKGSEAKPAYVPLNSF